MRLECRNLNFIYPGSDVAVLENLSFVMEEPGFNAVFGPSGVGKSSFARLLAHPRENRDSEIVTQGIHTVLYSYNLERLPGWSSTGSHLDKICPPGKEDLKKNLIQIFRLESVLDSRFSQLSMGQQNRMNLIRYLLQDFDLLILDESLANVDEKLRKKIILSVKEFFPDKMFLYISHNLMEVARFCREILVLGEASGQKENCMVRGRDYHKDYTLDKSSLDRVMLEIMNAF
ncbi:ATP-binding cassette domain-containing protein [Desulfospira joergensenii]|uniref:ATP-binding cassette domain-containing protein n=1 Tax=Desulfospira joergensenii TaxID=53329 RepID=UPI0003B47EA6|nr:ATP-binding cassette domain-containing protein [Desulfospira joergensenii]